MSQRQPKTAPVYVNYSGEVLLAAPPSKAWPHVIDYGSWQNYPVAEHVSGPIDGEGEVVRLQKKEEGFETAPYFARTIALEPGRRVFWKIFYDETPESEFFGTVEFRLRDGPDGSSIFQYNVLYEFRVKYHDESELEVFRKAQYDTFTPVIEAMWPKLQKVVEGAL